MPHSVLVVEDDAALRNGLMALLRISGHAAVAAATAAEGVTLLDAARPTHLLLDLNLPDAPGTHIIRRIHDQGLAVRVALVTGASDPSLLEEARGLGVDAVFIKPPDWDKLLDWVAGYNQVP